MNNWINCKFGDLITLNYGKSLVADKRIGGDIPVYSSSGLSGWHNEALVNSQGIIVGRKGTVGSVYYSKTPFFCIDTAFYIMPNKNYDLRFLYYKLLSMNLVKLASDSAVPGLNRDTVYSQQIKIPATIEEQRKIAFILTSLDEKIELNLQINEILDTICQTIFKEWFENFNFPNFNGEFINGLPTNWRKGKLSEVLNLTYGKALKSESRVEGKYAVVGSNGIVDYHNEYLVKSPGIVIGRKGTIGKVIWLDVNFFPIDTTFYIKNMLDVEQLYFHYYLLKNQNFQKIGSDSAVPGLNRTQALLTDIIIPSIEVIAQFNETVAPFFEKMKIIKEENQTLIQLRESILPKLMSEKLQINQ